MLIHDLQRDCLKTPQALVDQPPDVGVEGQALVYGSDEVIHLCPGTFHIGLGGNWRPVRMGVVDADNIQSGVVGRELDLGKLLRADNKAVGPIPVLIGRRFDLVHQAPGLKAA